MKKIVIITRSFPPVNKTAALRPLAWAENLHKYGYYPIIVTRNWDRDITNEDEVNYPSGKKVKHEKHENYEVYHVPYKATLVYRFISKYGRVKGITRLLWIIHHNFGHYFLFYPYRNMLSFLKRLFKENQDIEAFMLTVPTFNLVELGYRLNKATKKKWILDYRDEWHTSDILKIKEYNAMGINKLFNSDSLSNEKRWTSNLICFSTVSPSGVNNINNLIGKKGYYIPNGFIKKEFENLPNESLYSDFTITYAGWLYDTQQIEILIAAVRKMLQENPEIKIKLLFIGGNSFRGMAKRILQLSHDIKDRIQLTDRVSRSDSIRMQVRSHLLLLCSHKNAKGIPSSKLYEYIALRKPILVCPGDSGIINETVNELKNGYICNTIEQTKEILTELIKIQADKGGIPISIDEDKRLPYDRENQVQLVANMLRENNI